MKINEGELEKYPCFYEKMCRKKEDEHREL